ncbi:hypothetical protein MPSYJ_46650 [Mycolicibacterium psychrotolerans]|uniref:Uncharacterized protein n=1 Tax=Mycolicibacterium psychrotolerans TaxID=216929 RepID=A0A7I7MFV8_9MYCO|nr:hypothetical protein MPSYJ_46650 [Mycolicibacterium psychrotolerans]
MSFSLGGAAVGLGGAKLRIDADTATAISRAEVSARLTTPDGTVSRGALAMARCGNGLWVTETVDVRGVAESESGCVATEAESGPVSERRSCAACRRSSRAWIFAECCCRTRSIDDGSSGARVLVRDTERARRVSVFFAGLVRAWLPGVGSLAAD